MNKHDLSRDQYMLTGPLSKKGYDWWWHSFTAVNRKTGAEKPFYIEFFIINPTLSRLSPILGQDPKNKKEGKKPSYLMVNVGTWGEDHRQLHRFIPVPEVEISKKVPFSVKAYDCFLSETKTTGSVSCSAQQSHNPGYMCDQGTMEWNLKINKKIAFNVGYGASKFFRKINAFEMFWHAEGMKTEYEGTIKLDGEEYDVTPEKCFGYADKNWGSDFTSPWVWLSSCDLRSINGTKRLNNSVLEIGGGQPKIFHISIPRRLLMVLYYEGKDYEFNFSKFWTLTRTHFHCSEEKNEIIWEIHTRNRTHTMDVEARCNKGEMLLINYESPDGAHRHQRLWNGGTGTGTVTLKERRSGKILDSMTFAHAGCEWGEY